MDTIMLQAVEGELAMANTNIFQEKERNFWPLAGENTHCTNPVLALEKIAQNYNVIYIYGQHTVELDYWKWWDWSITFQIYSIEWIFSDLGLPDGKLISHEVPDGHDQNTLNHKYLNSWDNVGKGEQKKIVFVINAFAMARLVKTDAYLHAHQTASASDSLMVYTFATAGHNSFPGMVPNMGPLLNSLQILLDQI